MLDHARRRRITERSVRDRDVALPRRRWVVAGSSSEALRSPRRQVRSPRWRRRSQRHRPPRDTSPSTPLRLCDTRPGPGRNFGFSRVGSNVTRVKIAGRTIGGVTVPADATAAVFTVVGINRAHGRNYLSAYPAGTTWPGTSSVNMPSRNAAAPNLVTVQLGSGSVDILANKPADIVLDLAGVYVPAAGGRSKDGRYREIELRRVDRHPEPRVPSRAGTPTCEST